MIMACDLGDDASLYINIKLCVIKLFNVIH